MGLDMYIFKTNKNSVPTLLKRIRKAKDKDYAESLSASNQHWITLTPGETHNVHKLNWSIHWRKANHIHQWFSENVLGNTENSEDRYVGFVSKQQLIDLCERCEKVIDRCINSKGELEIDETFCKEIFPPNTTIPYSGSTDYDETFIHHVVVVLNQVSKLLATTNFQKSVLLYFAYW